MSDLFGVFLLNPSTAFITTFSLAFFGFLRVGEFTADKKSECGSHIIQFEDFSFVNSRDSTDLKKDPSK
jgi:hypothetical protein